MSTDLHSALRAVIEQRLEVARAASTRADDGATPTGEQWHWECSECDAPIEITPVTVLDEFLSCEACGHYGVDIRSVEEYETDSVGKLPHMVTHGTDEVRPVDGLFIVTHDPADAIRRYRNDLELLARYARLDAESEGNLTHDEIFERYAQLELLRDLISDLLDVYPEVTQ